MSEVEKMYGNAGVDYEERYNNCTLNKEGECKLKCSCDICKYSEEKYIYPPFTAEKQIELIKWLGIRDEFNFYQNKVTKDWVFYDHEKDATHYDFELCLASWVNYLWQDLTEEEKEQIRTILNE